MNQNNPYQSPEQVASAESYDPRSIYLYSELPRNCPSCSRQFSEVLFNKLFPRKYQAKTIIYFICVAIGGLLALPLIGLWPAAGLAFVMGAWGMTFNKVVRMKCSSCGWTQRFVVQRRG